MIAFKHYLLEAALKCIEDAGHTPYLICDTKDEGVVLPSHLAKDATLTLSLSRHAIRDFSLSEKGIGFAATFTGMPFSVYLPMSSVMAIYARENGHGLVTAGDFKLVQLFEQQSSVEGEEPDTQSDKNEPKLETVDVSSKNKVTTPKPTSKRPVLQLVK